MFYFSVILTLVHTIHLTCQCMCVCIVDFGVDSAIYSIIVELFVDFIFKFFSYRFNIPLDIKWSLPTVTTITCLNKYILGQIPRWNGALIFFTATFVTNMLFVQLLLHIVPRIARKPKIKR